MQAVAGQVPVVVNLASQEYFKAVNTKLLQAHVVQCVFEDFSGGSYKVVSFFAKKARGLMARYAIEQRIQTVSGLEAFAAGGYQLARELTTPERLVFRRDISV